MEYNKDRNNGKLEFNITIVSDHEGKTDQILISIETRNLNFIFCKILLAARL